jgi:hypothetical protein
MLFNDQIYSLVYIVYYVIRVFSTHSILIVSCLYEDRLKPILIAASNVAFWGVANHVES